MRRCKRKRIDSDRLSRALYQFYRVQRLNEYYALIGIQGQMLDVKRCLANYLYAAP